MKLLAASLVSVCALAQAPAADQAKLIAELEQENENYIRLLRDWGGLARYGSENTEIARKADPNRVVFLGDEITERWGEGKAEFFPGKPYLNRGIARQATPQMLVRFRQDVIDLAPKVVVIQGGLNDFAGFAGPATQGTIADNIMTMAELAKHHGIRVVLASLTPVCDCFANVTARRPPGKIIGMNGWLKDYAARNGFVYLDYHGALAEGRAMKRELTVDGVLPNDAGYALMAPLAEKAIREARQ